MKVLALDPSSTCIGMAVMTGTHPRDLKFAGKLTPDRTAILQDTRWSLPAGHMSHEDLVGTVRSMSLSNQLWKEIELERPDVIVVEVPSGKAGTGSRAGAKSSLAVYGVGAGVALQTCRAYQLCPTVPVSERQWTRGMDTRKFGPGKRGVQAKMQFYYHGFWGFSGDKGGDAADATALGLWWLENHGQTQCRRAS